MNMISTGAFLDEMDASNRQETLAKKFARVWKRKYKGREQVAYH